jgi:hypothetical protein
MIATLTQETVSQIAQIDHSAALTLPRFPWWLTSSIDFAGVDRVRLFVALSFS